MAATVAPRGSKGSLLAKKRLNVSPRGRGLRCYIRIMDPFQKFSRERRNPTSRRRTFMGETL